ncbi:carboxymuconolactone decarboxylase family protein [Atopobiaceae bacterium HCP3S3_F7]
MAPAAPAAPAAPEARRNGVTRDEIVAVVAHATMYCGWPKGWAVFQMVKEVWGEGEKDRAVQAVDAPA